jgi:hypothetical protein
VIRAGGANGGCDGGGSAGIRIAVCALLLALASGTLFAATARAADSSQAELLERLKRLEENQTKLYDLLKAKDKRLDELEVELKRTKAGEQPAAAAPAAAAKPGEPPVAATSSGPAPEGGALATADNKPVSAEKNLLKGVLGTYEQGRGFGFIRTQWGDVNFGIYTYVRYLNQKGLQDHLTNGPNKGGKTDHRDDLELNKVKIEFRGWLIDPHFRFTLYSWTNNAAQGLGAQVVLGGNLNWAFGPELTVGAGILSLPTTRSTAGNFPYWLAVDHRTAADEFFRGSYSSGFFGYGTSHGFGYYAMLATNLSILGVDASQLDSDFTTASVALWWMPTTGEFGPRSGFGDYEMHDKLATRIGGHFTFSPENRQSQPGSEDIDNTQIRLSNGTIIFSPGALAPDVSVRSVKYYMSDIDWGLKWRGMALEGEYYLRWLNDFNADGPLPTHQTFDHGFQLMASAMLLPQTLQAYSMGSYIFGDFGDSWEMTAGMNWFIFNRREVRFNFEYMYAHKSPVGYTAVPQAVGISGSIVDANLEMSF